MKGKQPIIVGLCYVMLNGLKDSHLLPIFPKDVVPNTTETRYGMAVARQDRTYKDYTSNPIPTSFLFSMIFYSIGYD